MHFHCVEYGFHDRMNKQQINGENNHQKYTQNNVWATSIQHWIYRLTITPLTWIMNRITHKLHCKITHLPKYRYFKHKVTFVFVFKFCPNKFYKLYYFQTWKLCFSQTHFHMVKVFDVFWINKPTKNWAKMGMENTEEKYKNKNKN